MMAHRERDAGRPAGAHDDGAFHRHLPEHLAGRGAERRSHLDLPLPPARPHQEKVREVRAGHQQHACGAAEQEQYGRSRGARDQIGQRRHMLREHRHPLPLADRQCCLSAREFGAGLGRSDTRAEAADDSHEAANVLVPVDGQREVHVDGGSREQGAGQREPGREYANDGVRPVLDRDGPAENVRASRESPLPIPVREHDGLGGARRVVAAVEQAAHGRSRAQHRKQLPCDSKAAHPFGKASTGHREDIGGVARPGANLLECRQMLLPVGELREPVRADHGWTAFRRARVVGRHPHEAVGLGERERLDQQRVRNREHARRRANAERQRDDDRHREHGHAAPGAYGDARGVPQFVEPPRDPDGARILLDERHIAEPQQSLTTGLLGRHASVDVRLCLSLDVLANVVVQIAQGPSRAHHGVTPW